jgi:hypothetical protein
MRHSVTGFVLQHCHSSYKHEKIVALGSWKNPQWHCADDDRVLEPRQFFVDRMHWVVHQQNDCLS